MTSTKINLEQYLQLCVIWLQFTQSRVVHTLALRSLALYISKRLFWCFLFTFFLSKFNPVLLNCWSLSSFVVLVLLAKHNLATTTNTYTQSRSAQTHSPTNQRWLDSDQGFVPVITRSSSQVSAPRRPPASCLDFPAVVTRLLHGIVARLMILLLTFFDSLLFSLNLLLMLVDVRLVLILFQAGCFVSGGFRGSFWLFC